VVNAGLSVTVVNPVHVRKHPSTNVVTVLKSTDVNAVHPRNASFPILVQLLRSTDVNDVQFQKALLPIVDVFVQSTETNEFAPLNVYGEISVIFPSPVTFYNEVQPSNVPELPRNPVNTD